MQNYLPILAYVSNSNILILENSSLPLPDFKLLSYICMLTVAIPLFLTYKYLQKLQVCSCCFCYLHFDELYLKCAMTVKTDFTIITF
jgi:hypothetical protein